MLAVESAHGGVDIRELMMRKYNQFGDWDLVAADLNVSRMTLWLWRRLMGVEQEKVARLAS